MKCPDSDNQADDDYYKENGSTAQDYNQQINIYRRNSYNLYTAALVWNHLTVTEQLITSILPRYCKYVALKMFGSPSMQRPQKYSPESEKFTCLIFRKRFVMLDVILNLLFGNPSKSEALESELNIDEMQPVLGPLAILNQKM